MARDFLLEIGTEEIPAKFASRAMRQLKEQALKQLSELRLPFGEVQVFATPRRLALLVVALEEKQEDLAMEVKGPAVKAAYDAQGAPTKAAQGFARGQGVAVEELFVQELNGVPYVYARKLEAGLETETLLPQLAQDLIRALHFPKPMRWGNLEFHFARPIRWLVALYGGSALDFEFVGLKSGRVSRGHRTLAAETITFEQASGYQDALRAGFVLADPEERRTRILKQIEALAEKVGGKALEDAELLEEVAHLVEYPTALLGEVALQYMNLPEAVITTPMREHQRYFPVRDLDGKLLPYFITVCNGDDAVLDTVRAGNEKVLKARLEDAAFYYREDRKTPLPELVGKLGKIVYHEKLGTVEQRVDRLRKLAQFIARKLGIDGERQAVIDRTALLAKADLVTLMVGDFPELQGIMGAEYAGVGGEPPEVCQGIREHYQPRFAGDALPASDAGRVISLADKLDAIVGAFGIGIQPTGSQDPYALRRQAQGIVAVILEAEWSLSLTELLEEAYGSLKDQGNLLLPLADLLPQLQDFFKQRLRFALQEQGVRYDTVEAALAGGSDELNRAAKRALLLAAKRNEENFTLYAQAYIRSVNLSKKEAPQTVEEDLLADEAEKALAQAIFSRREQFEQALAEGRQEEAYRLAGELVPHIEALFQAVMIMVEDENVRRNRLALLNQCAEMLGCLGDLSVLA